LFTGSPSVTTAVICTRIVSSKPVGTVGYLHVINDTGPTWSPWRRSLGQLARMEASDA
jgi:hypothetical protein